MRLLLLLLLLLTPFILGCSTENPLCSTTYCVDGEIFLRSQLLEGEEFSEVNVVEQSLIAAFANVTPQIPVETTPPLAETEVSVIDIINDVGNGSTKYLNQTVSVTGTVVWKNDTGTGILLYKNANVIAAGNDNARFFITTQDDPVPLAPYIVGNTYTFTVLIATIVPPDDDDDGYLIGARIVE